LSQLGISPGSLSPAFSPGMLSYTSTEDPAVTTVQLTAVANDTQALLSVDGVPSPRKGNYQGALVMNKTSNVSTAITVTSADGKANMTYVIEFLSSGPTPAPPPPPRVRFLCDHSSLKCVEGRDGSFTSLGACQDVCRAPPKPGPLLQNLTVMPGVMSPIFSPTVLTYTLTVPYGSTYATCTAQAVDHSADVTIQGHRAPGGSNTAPIMLPSHQATNFTVVVDSGAGTSTYTISVVGNNKQASQALLSQLEVSPGVLSPTFSPTTLVYQATEDPTVTTVQLSAVARDTEASLRVDGHPSPRKGNDQVALAMNKTAGSVASIVVVSADGNQWVEYLVKFNRRSTAVTV